jgi:hypothetical protein
MAGNIILGAIENITPKTVSDGFRHITIDPATHTIQTIDYSHHEIHSGSSYTVSVGQMVSDTNDRTAIGFTTGNTTKWAHMVITAAAGAASWLYVREAATIANTQGADVTCYNRDRNSSKTSLMKGTSTGTAVAGKVTYFAEADQADYTENGTLIYQEMLASGSKSKSGGTSRGTSELILKQNTAYLIYLKALNADDNVQNIVLDWYEHTNRD